MDNAENTSMDIKVRIYSTKPEGSVRARCSLELGGCFAVRGVKLMEGAKGYFLSMPSYRVGEGYKDICFATTKDFRKQLLDAVMREFEQTMQQAGHNAPRQQTAPQPPQAAQTSLPGYLPRSPYMAGM